MSNTSAEVTLVLLPAGSFARGAGGTRYWERTDQALLDLARSTVCRSTRAGWGNASRVAPIPPPRITVPTVPQFK
jgi:hypothetical protein